MAMAVALGVPSSELRQRLVLKLLVDMQCMSINEIAATPREANAVINLRFVDTSSTSGGEFSAQVNDGRAAFGVPCP